MSLNKAVFAAFLLAATAFGQEIIGGGNSGTVTSIATGNCLTGGAITATGTIALGTVILPKTSTYQVLAADFSLCKTITVASGTFTITLVDTATQPANGTYVDFINYGSGVVTIARSGQNINGGTASMSLAAGSATAPTFARVFSDGTNYFAEVGGGSGGGSGTVNTCPSGNVLAYYPSASTAVSCEPSIKVDATNHLFGISGSSLILPLDFEAIAKTSGNVWGTATLFGSKTSGLAVGEDFKMLTTSGTVTGPAQVGSTWTPIYNTAVESVTTASSVLTHGFANVDRLTMTTAASTSVSLAATHYADMTISGNTGTIDEAAVASYSWQTASGAGTLTQIDTVTYGGPPVTTGGMVPTYSSVLNVADNSGSNAANFADIFLGGVPSGGIKTVIWIATPGTTLKNTIYSNPSGSSAYFQGGFIGGTNGPCAADGCAFDNGGAFSTAQRKFQVQSNSAPAIYTVRDYGAGSRWDFGTLGSTGAATNFQLWDANGTSVLSIATGGATAFTGTPTMPTLVISNSSFTFNGHTCTLVSTVVTCP